MIVLMEYKVGTLAADRWAVTFGTVRRRLGRAAARPGPSSLYQMNSPSISGHVPTTVLLCGFNVAIKGLSYICTEHAMTCVTTNAICYVRCCSKLYLTAAAVYAIYTQS